MNLRSNFLFINLTGLSLSLTLLTTLLTTKLQVINHLFYLILCISHGINLCAQVYVHLDK